MHRGKTAAEIHWHQCHWTFTWWRRLQSITRNAYLDRVWQHKFISRERQEAGVPASEVWSRPVQCHKVGWQLIWEQRWVATKKIRTVYLLPVGYKEDINSVRYKMFCSKLLTTAICHPSMIPWGTMLHEPITKHIYGIGLWMQMPRYPIQIIMAGMWLTATSRSTGWINNLLQEYCYNSSVATQEKITVWLAGVLLKRVLCHAQMIVGALTVTTVTTLTRPKMTRVMKAEHFQNTI